MENLYLKNNQSYNLKTGVLAKKITDHLGLTVVNGSPFVEHRKASNVFKNLQKEAKGVGTNEIIFVSVQKVNLTAKNIIDCFLELAIKTKFPKEDYFLKLKKAMKDWRKLF